MQTSSRPNHDHSGSYRARHAPQISITDDSHHVTDAISSLYDYGDHNPPAIPEGRPLSFLPAARDEIFMGRPEADNRTFAQRLPLTRTQSDRTSGAPLHSPIQSNFMVGRSNSTQNGHHAQLSPPLLSPGETATSQFPLTAIDYESSPAAVAQELSNLQAIRRMSMDVNAVSDPDLPSFGMPTLAPTGANEDDTSRLFWVPASLHPELAPTEFKTFLDNRVETIRRRSGDYSSLSPDSPMRTNSDGGLRRKKSMLSRQIDTTKNADQYQDGAERLDRKRSQGEAGKRRSSGIQNLQELEQLMQDPSKVIQRLSLESQQSAEPGSEDMPILPAAPGGGTLRRSTRTTYRRGSLKKGERIPPSRRAQRANTESEGEDMFNRKKKVESPTTDEQPILGLTRVQTEPISSPENMRLPDSPVTRSVGNFSRPGRRAAPTSPSVSSGSSTQLLPQQDQRPQDLRYQNQQSPTSPQSEQYSRSRKSPPPQPDTGRTPEPMNRQSSDPQNGREHRHFVSQIASNGRTTARLDVNGIEPQSEDRVASPQSYHSDREAYGSRASSNQQSSHLMNRTKQRTGMGPQPVTEQQTLQHMGSQPSPLPGSNSTRTDSLTFIPTLTEDRSLPTKKDTKKSGWSWGSLLGSEEKEKERRKEEELREANNKKLRQKLDKPARLDVLQQTMEPASRSRESLVLDRGDMKLEEERKKESRKASESKKEKDSGLFSSLFGGKKKHDKENAQKTLRPPTPDSPARPLVPDVDYRWTRFAILEERAIYRMAHIKLANPRRALYSQVLLSNFMYSYLAKVQQMHPTIQIPQSAAQKAQARVAAQQAQQQAQQQQQQGQQQSSQQQQRNDQPEEYYQYQRYQEQLQQQESNLHQASQQLPQQDGSVQYMDDAQSYAYDHADDQATYDDNNHHTYDDNNGHVYGQQDSYGYQNQRQQHNQSYQYQHQQEQYEEDDRHRNNDEMW